MKIEETPKKLCSDVRQKLIGLEQFISYEWYW